MYGKIWNFKKEGIIEKISYERRTYESADDWNHSQVISQKINEKENSGTNGLMDTCNY